MSAADRMDVKSTALILNDLQRAIISGSPLAPSEPDALARFSAAVERCAEALKAARGLGISEVRLWYDKWSYPGGMP